MPKRAHRQRPSHVVGALFALGFTLLSSTSAAVPIPGRPVGRVLDHTGTLSATTIAEVVRRSARLENDTGAELALVMIETTQPEAPKDFALRLFNEWGIGKRDMDNGVLILFSLQDRRVEIMPGTGLKELLTQRLSEILLKDWVIPEMRKGNTSAAVLGITKAVAAKVADFYEAPSSTEPPTEEYAPPQEDAPPQEYEAPETSDYEEDEEADENSFLELLNRHDQRFVFLLAILMLNIFPAHFYWTAFRTGKLLTQKASLVFFMAFIALLGGMSLKNDAVEGFGFAAATLFINWFLYRHICPQCNKWCGISTVTLVRATKYSTGTGERTYSCLYCLYHHVETYTISKISESSSSSSSSSSGGSYGGGSSSGGGGGASW